MSTTTTETLTDLIVRFYSGDANEAVHLISDDLGLNTRQAEILAPAIRQWISIFHGATLRHFEPEFTSKSELLDLVTNQPRTSRYTVAREEYVTPSGKRGGLATPVKFPIEGTQQWGLKPYGQMTADELTARGTYLIKSGRTKVRNGERVLIAAQLVRDSGKLNLDDMGRDDLVAELETGVSDD